MVFHDFTDKRGRWDTAYRCIYTKPIKDRDGQVILVEFDRPESLIYSNLGMDNMISKKLMEVRNISVIEPEAIIEVYHNQSKGLSWVDPVLPGFLGTEFLAPSRKFLKQTGGV